MILFEDYASRQTTSVKSFKASALLLGALLISWQPAVAENLDLQTTLKKMAELLAEQQQELDAQRKELAEQRALIRQLQAAQPAVASESAAAPAAQEPLAPPATAITQQSDPASSEGTATPDSESSAQDQAKEALAKQQAAGPGSRAEEVAELQKSLDDPSNTIYDADFPGAWYLPGTTAAMKIGGYVNLSLVNSFSPMLIQDRFIVGSIPPDGESVPGAVEGTSVSADQTRLNLEYREQTRLGEVRAFIEGDFRGDSDSGTTEIFRLRHAFGQFRAILVGKTWSTLMDVDARPEEVDVEGMNGQILLRHSQIRWTPKFGEKWELKLALEDPVTDVSNGTSERSRGDLIASVVRMPLGPLGRWNYRVGFVLRDLQATGSIPDPEGGLMTTTDSTTGWGVTTGGRQPVTWWGEGDFLLWQLSYGQGLGHYINDLSTIGGGDAVFDPDGKLHALPVFAGYLSYQHLWPKRFKFMKNWPGILRSNFTIGVVDIGNFDFQDGSDYNRTIRASANLIYNPTTNVQLGMEFLWGERRNKNESKGTASQLQFAARYSF
jgi:hypothetical protein